MLILRVDEDFINLVELLLEYNVHLLVLLHLKDKRHFNRLLHMSKPKPYNLV